MLSKAVSLKLDRINATEPYYYIVLLRFDRSKVKIIEFLVPRVGVDSNIKKYVVPVNTIETIIRLDFFPELDNKIENKV